MVSYRPVARIDLGVRDTQKWTFWTQKVDFLNLIPLPSYKRTPHFWCILWLKVDFLADGGGGVRRTRTPHPLATGL